jgi:predicted ATPase/class 3 adenylate cyclase
MNAGPITQTFVSAQPRTYASEIRALLLTDVVDSTKLSEQLGDDAMASVWEEHDRVARDLLPTHQGREIDKTDGMLLLFDNAASATNYAMAYHRALAAMQTPLKARAGLHVGSVILRENSADDVARGAKPLEVDGLAKPTAARVMSLAIGGQTLLTPEAKDNLGETELKLHSHGHWVMKGVSEPVELFEAGAPSARFVAPTDSDKVYRVIKVNDNWLPVKEIPNNLPAQGTSFVGREKELEDIKALLGSARLVTLLGMGGLGKTRLSLQAATELMHQFPDGVWFLDLSPITDPTLALAEAAQVLGVREEPDRPLLQTVCAHLKNKRLLMVFDNCEHLIKASADLAHAVVKAAPFVRLAASSREALRIPGERAYPILPLPVPKVGDTLASLQQSTAVRLFVARAQAHKPAFELNVDNADAVAELVARLEGIPLALELAAARVRALSIPDINKRLSDRYKLLTGGARVHQERQQTLRALVDWSYDMLSDAEKTLLNRLAVFKGGWDMEAAEAVCGTAPLDPMDVLDTLTSLVEKSLVMLDESGDTTRYKMLETIRDYAREKLEGAGDVGATELAHCAHYFGLSKEIRAGMKSAKQGEFARRFEAEIDNIRAAIHLPLSGVGDPLIAAKIAVNLQGPWILGGYATEGRKVIEQVLALPAVQAQDAAQAFVLYCGAALAQTQGDYEDAKTMLETCLELRRKLNNPGDIAATLSTLSAAYQSAGHIELARETDRQALALFLDVKQPVNAAIAHVQLAQYALFANDLDDAQNNLEKALALARTHKHPETENDCERVGGELEFERGNYSAATQRIAKSLNICLAAHDRRGAALALWWLAKVGLAMGEVGDAKQRLSNAIAAFHAFEMREPLIGCLEDVAYLSFLATDASEAMKSELAFAMAVRLAASAEALRTRFKLNRSASSAKRWEAEVSQMRSAMQASVYEVARNQGQQWELADAVQAAIRVTAGSAPS